MKKKTKMNSITKLTMSEKTINPVYNPLKNKMKRNSEIFLSRYKKISPQTIYVILSKNKNLRLDIENRMLADYLSKKFN